MSAMKKTCKNCGIEFTATNIRREYCSKSCRTKAEKQRKKDRGSVKTSFCAYCGKPFLRCPSNKKYCNYLCANQAYKEIAKEKRKLNRKVKPITTKTCPQCGREYTPKKKTQQFCSRLCARKHAAMIMQEYNQQRIKRTFPFTPGICPVCGTALGTKTIKGKYCSTECNDLARFYHKATHDDIASMNAIEAQIAKLESMAETMSRQDFNTEKSNYNYKKQSLIDRVLNR